MRLRSTSAVFAAFLGLTACLVSSGLAQTTEKLVYQNLR